MNLSSFKDLKEGTIFHFDGATYMKHSGSNGHKCFMIKGFVSNNHPENINEDSICKILAESFAQWAKNDN